MRVALYINICIVLIAPCAAYANGFQHFAGHDERDDFLAAADQLGPTTTIDFVGLGHETLVTDQYEDLGVTFGGSAFTVENRIFQDGIGIVDAPFIDIRFAQPQYWFGVDLFGDTDGYFGDFFLHGEFQYTISLFAQFDGFIADKPFDSVIFYDSGGGPGIIDNFYFGAPVPAPSALFILLAGSAIGWRRRE